MLLKEERMKLEMQEGIQTGFRFIHFLFRYTAAGPAALTPLQGECCVKVFSPSRRRSAARRFLLFSG